MTNIIFIKFMKFMKIHKIHKFINCNKIIIMIIFFIILFFNEIFRAYPRLVGYAMREER